MRRAIVALATMMLAGCEGQRAPPVAFEYRTSVAWSQRADAQAEVDRTVAWALNYWSAPADVLDGWRVTFVDDDFMCGDVLADGCAELGAREMLVRGVGRFPCAEATMLAHELGHVALNDPSHTDPRWGALDTMLTDWAVQQAACVTTATRSPRATSPRSSG